MPTKRCALTILSILFAGVVIRAEQDARRSPGESPGAALTLVGRVQQIHAPRIVSVENRLAEERRVLVLLPEGSPVPPSGSVVHARGALRRVDQAQLADRPWSELEPGARSGLAGRSVLIASSFELAATGATDTPRQPLPARVHSASRSQVRVRPAALAGMIGELAGFDVTIPYARVVGLFDSRTFLVDSAVNYQPALGERDRILVVLSEGALRVPAETLVASTVTVVGVARSILGLQAGSDVPWPAQLDRDTLKRLEVRAAVLATSVHTAEGVELTDRQPVR